MTFPAARTEQQRGQHVGIRALDADELPALEYGPVINVSAVRHKLQFPDRLSPLLCHSLGRNVGRQRNPGVA
jgi:hypothetical protein